MESSSEWSTSSTWLPDWCSAWSSDHQLGSVKLFRSGCETASLGWNTSASQWVTQWVADSSTLWQSARETSSDSSLLLVSSLTLRFVLQTGSSWLPHSGSQIEML